MVIPNWEEEQRKIFAGESGGDYGALFGYQNRPNGLFSNIDVTQMSIGDVINFTDPAGPYANYVKSQVGRVATPVGAYQVVGKTLRAAVEDLGLDPSQKFNKQTQDAIGKWVFSKQGPSAWEGYGKGGAMPQVRMSSKDEPQEEKKGFLGGGLLGALGMNADMLDRLAIAALSGVGGTSQFQPMIAQRASSMEKRQEIERAQAKANQTAAYFESINRNDLAKLVRDGAISGRDAFSTLTQERAAERSLAAQQSAADLAYKRDLEMLGVRDQYAQKGEQRQLASQKELAEFQNTLTKPKLYEYQQLAKDLLRTGAAKTEQEALTMAMNKTKSTTTINVGATGIDYGKPPPDMAWKRDANGAVVTDDRGIPIALPISGTKAYNDMNKIAATSDAIKDQTIVSGGVVLGNIDKIRKVMEDSILPTTGIFGQALRNIGGTAALDVNVLLRPIEASIGFERLQQMREASPTGGALGQVTERELDLLKSTLGSLDQAQSEAQFLQTLGQVETMYENIIKKFDAYPPEAMAAAGYTPRLASEKSSASTEDLLKKYGD